MDENNSELLKLLNSKKDFKYDRNKITLTIKQSIEKAGKRGKSLIEILKYKNRLLSIQTPSNPFYRFKPIFVMCDKGRLLKILDSGKLALLETKIILE